MLRHFQHIKAEFSFDVRQRVFLIRHYIPIFLFQLGIQKRHRVVRSNAMAIRICGVMRHRAQRESVIVQVLGVVHHCENKIGAAYVMREVTKKMAAVRVVTHVLNDGPAVRVSMRLAQFVGRGVRKSFQ